MCGDNMYDFKQYNVTEDLEVQKLISNDLSPYSIATYLSRIKEFCNCIGKKYCEIINEVKGMQRDKIIGNEIIRYNPNDSLINDYIHKYINYLSKKNNKISTINLKIKQILILLKKSNIEIPKISLKKEPTQTKVQLITTDDIRFILKNSSIYHQAMITFMASTGVRRYDLVNNFKIEDFIDACSDYTDAIYLDDFLEEVKEDMIPFFEFIPHKTSKTGLPCKVCCSSEASNLIIQSLKLRKKSIEKHNKEYHDNLKLTEESPLFGSKKRNYIGKFNEHSISAIFTYKNKLLKKHKEKELDYQLKNHQISKKEWRIKKNNIPSFHPHSLRHRFISTVRAYTTNRDISLLMEGHASSINTDRFYVGESEELFNKETIRKTYLQVMPYLTFFSEIDPVSYIQEKEKNDKLQKEIKSLKKKVSEFEEIESFLKENSVLNKL